MRVFATWFLILGLAVAPALAGTGEETKKDAAATKTADKPGAEAKTGEPAKSDAPPSAAAMEAELQQLRDLILAQTQELEAQRAALHEQEQRMETLEGQLKLASSPRGNLSAAAGNSGVMANSVNPNNGGVVLSSDGVGANGGSGNGSGQDGNEGPASIRFKGITLTPGGFLAAETVWRQRALSGDVNTPFNSIPFPGSSNAHVTEFNASGRQSRLSMLGEGQLSHAKLTGYYEMDFLSAGVTSNNNQSNSYTLRQRQAWAQASLDSGWIFTGGQMWSLVTETRKGITTRTEATPMTIDAEYHVGFSWTRQYGFRVTKDFGDKVWLAMSVENPQVIFGGHGFSGTNPAFLLGALGAGGGLLNSTANYSYNATPDFVVKAAFEPGFGHYEVFGLVRTFRDRIFPNDSGSTPSAAGAFNNISVGGGFGANARVPIVAHKLDFGVHFLGGDGVGRYGSSTLSDVTIRPNLTLAMIRSYQGLASLEAHLGPKFDLYAYAGGEYDARAAYTNAAGSSGIGYGSPLYVNTGCSTETLPTGDYTAGALGSCSGDIRNLLEGTLGFWYRFYKGSKGTIQWGSQYSYVVRNSWSGVGGQPVGNDNMIFTSLRYYIP